MSTSLPCLDSSFLRILISVNDNMGPNSMQEIIRSRVLHDTMETYEEGDSCTNSQPQQLIKQGGQLHALAHGWGPQVPIR